MRELVVAAMGPHSTLPVSNCAPSLRLLQKNVKCFLRGCIWNLVSLSKWSCCVSVTKQSAGTPRGRPRRMVPGKATFPHEMLARWNKICYTNILFFSSTLSSSSFTLADWRRLLLFLFKKHFWRFLPKNLPPTLTQNAHTRQDLINFPLFPSFLHWD